MKKNLMFAMFGAIALTGAVGLTSCTDEEVAEVNPGYNPETGEVPVNFVMNISTNNQGKTRMSANTVQMSDGVTQPFRGIEKALLLTYKLKDGSGNPDDGKHIFSSSTVNDKVYDLDKLVDVDGLGSDPLSRRVLTMSLPTQTNTLLFWGKAIQAPLTNNKPTASVYGSIEYSPSTTLSEASFKLNPCVPDDGSAIGRTALVQYENVIEAALNKIINAGGAVNETDGDKVVHKTMKWSDYVSFNSDGSLTALTYDPSTKTEDDTDTPEDESYEVQMSPLGEILAKTFVTLNTFKRDELRNGQGKIIAALIGDICSTMAKLLDTNETIPTTVEEKAAVSVASYVQTAIHQFFKSTDHTWNAIGTVKQNSGIDLDDIDLVTKDLKDFPDGIFRLPPGATVMKYYPFDGEGAILNEYHYMTNVPTYAMGQQNGSFDPFNYMYPAELCYFGNSPIRVTTDTHEKADYPDGVANWDDDKNWDKDGKHEGYTTVHHNTVDWTRDGHVLSSTRSVAMQENINYGTAMLMTTVKYADGVTTLYDNNEHFHPTEQAQEIVPGGDGFKLTGILVGGQVQEVGWNYIAKATTPAFDTMVYDDQLPSTTIPASGTSTPNYTLVWDNWNPSPVDDEGASTQDQNKVYIALQFTNDTGKDFWGQNNMIRNGSTFYLIGLLDPDAITVEGKTTAQIQADKSLGIDWPTKYALPPYDGNGTIKARRVFIQDFMTTANFVIGQNSLKYALVSVPDLRSSQISLGLSVDLNWSKGLNFNNIVIGGN